MRQARAWSCISPHVVSGMKLHHLQRVGGGTRQPRAHKNKSAARPALQTRFANKARGRHYHEEEPHHFAHEAIVRP